MSFCPSCGAQNSDDARFCNKCGTAITPLPSSGATASGGAPTPPSPPPTNTGGTVTLAGIGIQSPGKTYAVLAVGALAFLALGAGIAWVGMHSGTPTTTATAETTDGTSGTGGDALPEGVDVPDDDFVMTSGARVVKRGPSAATGDGTPPSSGASTGTGGTGATDGSGGTPPSTGTAGHTTPPTGTHATHTGTTGTTGTHTGTTGTTGSTGATDPIAPPPTGTSSGTPPPSSTVDWDSMSGTVADPAEEPDYQMQMYSTQIRRFIRANLLPQSTACFEHASATTRDPVRGTVAIGFDIDARGHARSATIDRNTTGNDRLALCLQNNVNSWQLPPPPEGTAPIQMQMPFTR